MEMEEKDIIFSIFRKGSKVHIMMNDTDWLIDTLAFLMATNASVLEAFAVAAEIATKYGDEIRAKAAESTMAGNIVKIGLGKPKS